MAILQAGDEFARGKVIADRSLPETTPGAIDHNSCEKDDETDWLINTYAGLNRAFTDYYRGCIVARSMFASLRRVPFSAYTFLAPVTSLAGGYLIDEHLTGLPLAAVVANANRDTAAEYDNPNGRWSVLVGGTHAATEELREVAGRRVTVPCGTGPLLMRLDAEDMV